MKDQESKLLQIQIWLASFEVLQCTWFLEE